MNVEIWVKGFVILDFNKCSFNLVIHILIHDFLCFATYVCCHLCLYAVFRLPRFSKWLFLGTVCKLGTSYIYGILPKGWEPWTNFHLSLWISANTVGNINTAKSLQRAESNLQAVEKYPNHLGQACAVHLYCFLGTGEAGKSTFIKNLRMTQGNGYEEEERKKNIPIMHKNILEGKVVFSSYQDHIYVTKNLQTLNHLIAQPLSIICKWASPISGQVIILGF